MFRKNGYLLLSYLLIAGCGDKAFFEDVQPEGEQTLEDGLAYTDVEPVATELMLDNTFQAADFGSAESQFEELQLGAALPSDGRSHIEGEWSASYPWPLAPIHAALLPNGSVVTYGSGSEWAKRGRALEFDRWNPSQGFSQSAHEFTPSGIDTNVFCSAQTIMPDGNLLISGGDKQDSSPNDPNRVNEGIRSSSLYNSDNHTVSKLTNMRFERWYPTLVTLGNGDQVTLGGKSTKEDEDSRLTVPIVPEIYVLKKDHWRVLWRARNREFFTKSWFYPRAWLNERGTVTALSSASSDIFELDPNGRGSFEKVGNMKYSWTRFSAAFPAVMYRPGKVLAMTNTGDMHTLDINSTNPTSVEISNPSGIRYWGNTTVLPDGKVFLVGGSREYQSLEKAVHFGEIWDSELDTWTQVRESKDKKARLYHSISLLLPDASVLVAGGGPPGPVINMNAEIYYPPYLFSADGSGDRAERPVILSIDELAHGVTTNIIMANNQQASRVTLVRSGSVTHSFDSSQRFMDLEFSQTGGVLSVSVPENRNAVPPGLYMLFVFDDKGVPSQAKLQLIK